MREFQRTATKDLANLDFLRASAVLMVLADHLLYVFGHKFLFGFNAHLLGYLGVILFFVHTSLVLMYSLERQRESLGPAGLFADFYLRRAFRIYPLSILTVLAAVLLRIPRSPLETFVPISWSVGLLNITLTQNLARATSVQGVLWSLPLEVQMYLVLPILFLLVRHLRGRSVLLLFPVWLISWALAVLTPQLELPLYATEGGHRVASVLWNALGLVHYAPYFLTGIIAYRLAAIVKPRLGFLWLAGALAAVTMAYTRAPGENLIPSDSIATLFLGVCLPLCRQLNWQPLKATCHAIAKYSYGVYLTHSICIWFAFVVLRNFRLIMRWPIFLAMAVALPVILYHSVELPMIRLGMRITEGWAQRRVKKAVAAGAA